MLGVSRPIYVNVDSPNLGFPYFNFLGGYQLKKHPVYGYMSLQKYNRASILHSSKRIHFLSQVPKGYLLAVLMFYLLCDAHLVLTYFGI